MTDYAKPIPVADDETQPFWDAARNHELAFQRCKHCGNFAHPPVAFCENCHRLDDPQFEFEAVSGRGKIVNWTVMHDAMVSGFDQDVPWVHALIVLDEQPDLMYTANLEDGQSDRLQAGAPVEVVFNDVTPTVTIPSFKLAD